MIRPLFICALCCVLFSIPGLADAEDNEFPGDDKFLAWLTSDAVEFYGSIEFETRSEEGFADVEESGSSGGTTTSDSVSIDLGLAVQPSPWLGGMLEASWDNGEPIEIDEAWLTLGNPERFPVYGSGGKMTLPFGLFETVMLTDPLTQDIGEIKSEALLLGVEWEGLQASAFTYAGTTRRKDNGEQLRSYGGNISYLLEQEDFSFLLGGSLISNIEDSDGLSEYLDDEDLDLKGRTPGMSAYTLVAYGPFSLGGEYIESTERPELIDEDGARKYARHKAWATEAAVEFELYSIEMILGVAYSESEGLGDLLPKKRVGGTVTVFPIEHVRLAFEYLREDDYSVKDGGTGDQADILTFQLALEWE